jgi:lysophospholipase L1-like esterase
MLRRRLLTAIVAVPAMLFTLSASETNAQTGANAPTKWVTSWAASAHGPYPIGNPSAQPEQKFAFPAPESGAQDQTFRMVLKPDLWGGKARLRFTNVYGKQPLVLDTAYIGLQESAGNLVKGTNRPVTFGGGKTNATIAPGQMMWSDPVDLKFVKSAEALAGRKLAVSFHVAGPSGPMTWHAKALQTSYVSPPKSGVHSKDESDAKFPYTTASWFFLDALDVMAPANTAVIVCFGDSITDGTASTMNGDDRWPDVLSHRLHAIYGNRIAVVNAGIGGNRVVGPADYNEKPIPGGPGSLDRLERDVMSLSGVTTVIWMEGINDYGAAGTSVDAVTSGFREGVQRMKAKGLKVIGATLTSALHATNNTHGTDEVDQKRRATNEFIRNSGTFDGVADFDAATLDAQTGEIKPEFQPNSTTGGPGDKLHPNRAGYQAMANSIDLNMLRPPLVAKKMAGVK